MTSPTSWILYASAEEAWNAILADCAAAKESIALETYIFVADDQGRKLIDICAERAAAGVEVRFLWDSVGSFSFFGSNIVNELAHRGIKVVFWKTLVPAYAKVPNWRAWFFRNHRRTIVIDGKVGYTGSMSVYDRMKDWRETMVRLEGRVTAEMQSAFDRMWARATDRKPLPARVRARDHALRYITNYPAPGRRHIYSELIEAIRHARKYIYITTPYFVPTRRLVRVLRLAAQRGVDVRIILPENSNWMAVDLGARSYFNALLSAGIRIFLYSAERPMIHAKTAVIDGDWATIGSMNLDRISLLYNFEANVVTTNSRLAEELAAHFIHDLKNAEEVSAREWKDRFFVEKIPEVLIRLVRKFL